MSSLITHFRAWLWVCEVLAFAYFCGLEPAVFAEEPAGATSATNENKQTIRCVVIGGMMDTGLWPEVAKRFEARTGHRVDVVASGPKHVIAPVFAAGDVDLITMHSSDAIINLVADGHGVDPQPWTRNDLLLVGPKSDPAGVRGEKEAIAALRKIIATKNKILVHASLGTNEVLNDVLDRGELTLDPEHTISLPSDAHRQMLKRAATENAYTLVGRIPFLNSKIPSGDMEIMVQGDPLLRRPYLVVVASSSGKVDPRNAAARQLASFLRSPETQAWMLEFGRGELDDRPLFFPVQLSRPDHGAKATQASTGAK